MDEQILVIKRSVLVDYAGIWQGIKRDPLDKFQEMVTQKKEFHPRSLMEINEEYKQVIPYLVFRHRTTYFLMQRSSDGNERRLHNKYSLGIGGHIRQDDCEKDSIIGWAEREFNEEVAYKGSYAVRSLGLLNDDSESVGRVHVGCLLLLEADSDTISIKSELKSGTLQPLTAIEKLYPYLEPWSQAVFKELQKIELE